MKHIGISQHRLASNPMEKAFAEAWEKEAPGTLAFLLHGQDKHDHSELTQAEATVAATIIQWLGSPVGANFVRDVHESMPAKKKRSLREA